MSQSTVGLSVRYHVLTDERTDLSRLLDESFVTTANRDANVRRNRRWFTSLCYDEASGRLYCGQTHRAGNILHAFDPATGTFEDLGYDRVAEDNEMKVHRGLWLDGDQRALYFGVASLSPTSAMVEAPGGKLVRYDIEGRRFQTLGIPLQGNYIQATNYDPTRQLMYAFLEPSRSFAVWSVRAGELVRVHCMDSIVHVSDLDDRGGVWGTYSHQHAFFRYDPDADRFEFPDGCVLPTAREAAGVMYEGAGPVDCLINGGDGFLYVASGLGELYRLEPTSAELRYLGRPLPYRRLPAVRMGADGMLYGVGGDDNGTTIFRYDREQERFELLGQVRAPDGTTCFRPHDLALVGGVAYVAETDTPDRSGYLWECRL
jgi:hypothetical protein